MPLTQRRYMGVQESIEAEKPSAASAGYDFFTWWSTQTKRPWDGQKTTDYMMKLAFEAGQESKS